MPTPDTRSLGAAAEETAGRYLEAQGLRIIQRNFCCKCGEIDLICVDDDVLVIVEVRSRRRLDFGGAAASVTRAKQRRILCAARYFLRCNPSWQAYRIRCDVVAFQGAGSNRQPEWLRDAFALT